MKQSDDVIGEVFYESESKLSNCFDGSTTPEPAGYGTFLSFAAF